MKIKKVLGIVLIGITTLSCSESPDESVNSPDVSIIIKKINLVGKEYIPIKYTIEEKISYKDSINYYLSQAEQAISCSKYIKYELKTSNDIVLLINTFKTKKEQFDELIEEHKSIIEETKYSNNRKKYRVNYQNWVKFKRDNKSNFIKNKKCKETIESLSQFSFKIQKLNNFNKDSIFNKVTSMRVYINDKNLEELNEVKALLEKKNNEWIVNRILSINKIIK